MLVFYVSTNASAVLLLFTGKFIIFILSFFYHSRLYGGTNVVFLSSPLASLKVVSFS